MEREVAKNDARAGNTRPWLRRVHWVSLALATVLMAGLYILFRATTP